MHGLQPARARGCDLHIAMKRPRMANTVLLQKAGVLQQVVSNV